MITYKGRVVYERIEHKMTEKDAARIMAAVTEDLGPGALAKKLWGIDVEIVRLQVLDDEAILEFVEEFLKLFIDWFKPGLAWLWDMVWGVLSLEAPPEPEVEEETTDG